MLKTLSEQIQGELAKRNKYFCSKHCRNRFKENWQKEISIFAQNTVGTQIQGELTKEVSIIAKNTVGTAWSYSLDIVSKLSEIVSIVTQKYFFLHPDKYCPQQRWNTRKRLTCLSGKHPLLGL